MGAAAYNRGSTALSAEIQRDYNGWEEFGFPQKTLWKMMEKYSFYAFGFSEDEYGLLLELAIIPKN